MLKVHVTSPRIFILLTLLLIGAYGMVASYPTESGDLSKGDATCMKLEHSQPLKPDNIHIASWNIFKGKKNGWEAQMAELVEPSALILIQEAPHHPTLHAHLDSAHHWQFAPGFQSGAVQTGVLTAAQGKANMHCRLRHYEPWLRTPKAALITRYELEGSNEQLLVANVHAVNFSLGVRAFHKQFADIAKVLKEHEGPIILAGDFNTWNRQRLAIIDGFAAQLQLTPVNFDPKLIKQFGGMPLDHVYFRGLDLTSHAVQVVESSDHNILKASFSL